MSRDGAAMRKFLGLAGGDRCVGFFMLASSDRIDSYRSARRPVDDCTRFYSEPVAKVGW